MTTKPSSSHPDSSEDKRVGQALTIGWIDRGIALMTLTRPKEMNTLTLEFLDEFSAALDWCEARKTRALIVTGQERAFCCGAHLKYFAGAQAHIVEPFQSRDTYFARIATLFDRLEELRFPTIAAINGYALGGGFELALSCDFRVIDERTKVGLPETKLGAIAGAGGVQKLIRHVGRSTALDWILRATHVEATRAAQHGLFSEVVPGDRLMGAALGIAHELRALAPTALTQSKRTIYTSEDADLRSARRFGVDALSMLVGGDEWKEGMAAFVEKRQPRFGEW
ncbi:enoyl-CoA hydratase/isomerase family protein [Variovorax sp. IB41]|uniref:enoyl-CoA hydratase/isomerase family protein n=1 Tax=Variovorax sp. IB41 TaxID=2779370 RepID=UPI0018E73AD7|nr:enoyl-CoA hydratase/isomerase family protein [Variovorax sp. IB41]MBJ2154290.1 enoyl-CoA hydratase/isomerase family protein [Variovorax sp. IB41]